MEKSAPIGVFDSGLGGIIVLRELMKAFPNENFVYFGDTANVPYGEKTEEKIIKLGQKNIDFMISKKCKLICAACGTVSSQLKKIIYPRYEKIPIIGIIKPVCKMAIEKSGSEKIGIIATNHAVNSNAYFHTIKMLDNSKKIIQKGCPKFVDIIENRSTEPLDSALTEYLSEFIEKNVNILILGCTHFPIIKDNIAGFFSKFNQKVELIDPGITLAHELKIILKKMNMENYQNNVQKCDFFVSKKTTHFTNETSKILGKNINFSIYNG